MVKSHQTYTTGSVNSNDGTVIGFRQLGSGPGVILLHGAVSSSQLFMKLGTALSDAFTVYMPDRRGRGLSGPFGDKYGIQKEVEDLDAILNKTDAHNVFGLSAGALIALYAALRLPAIRKAALYEPPLDIDNSTVAPVASFMPRFDQEIAEGKVAEAIVTFIKNFAKQFETREALLSILPRPILVRLFTRFFRNEAKNVKGDDVPFQALLPTFHFDHQPVVETAGTLEDFRAVHTEVLLLGGSKSPSFLKHTLDALSEVLPNVERVELPGLGHGAPTDRGRPERVAQELRRFFL
ncbi:MAG: alpha/beta hydrolase [Halobacteriota archaeon]